MTALARFLVGDIGRLPVVNWKLFGTKTKSPAADAANEAGGAAYRLGPKHALAQLAATGTLHNTFYATGKDQIDELLKLAAEIADPTFTAKLAVYSREKAAMKDMPAALALALAKQDPALFHRVFDRVVDNGRVLRTMLQMLRSGKFGRKGLSSSLQRAFQRWLNEASVGKLLAASIGKDPSLRDVLRLARPTPPDNARRALFGWLVGNDEAKWAPASRADLPQEVVDLEAFRAAETGADQAALVERLPARWDLLAGDAKDATAWAAMAKRMGPQALRMNLNTLVRHGVLTRDNPAFAQEVAAKLADADEIRRSRQFPYQFFAAYMAAGDDLPDAVKRALVDAAETALGNVPAPPGGLLIGLDTSGSMASPATGQRGRGATSKMRCVDVAALFAAALLRRNPDSVVVPFDTQAYEAKLDGRDSILSLAERLAKYGGGGTDCSLPLAEANGRLRPRRFAGAVLVSDNESWVGTGRRGATGVMTQWRAFVANQRRLDPAAAPKLVCLDIQPYATTQAPERADILNVGGFSDAVFAAVAGFFANDAGGFVREVEAVVL